jgi:uncharacterized protein
MFIEIQELEQHPIDFDEKFAPGQIDFGPDLEQTSDLKAAGRAQLVEEHHGKHQIVQDIRTSGELAGRFRMACARCLEPVDHKVTHQFDLLYRPLGVDGGRAELSVTAAEAEISYYEGDSLLLKTFCASRFCLPSRSRRFAAKIARDCARTAARI